VTENPVKDTLLVVATWLEQYADRYGKYTMTRGVLRQAALDLREKAGA
jgi:hypothetical protein